MRIIWLIAIPLLTSCASVPRSSLDYDWYYSSEVKKEIDKFEGETKISISPIEISSSSGPYGRRENRVEANFFYQHGKAGFPEYGFFTLAMDSSTPVLEGSSFKFESRGEVHEGRLVTYAVKPRKVGTASMGAYSRTYSESTQFVEIAVYRFDIKAMCPFDRLAQFEFKAHEIYKLEQGYSVSLSKWCEQVALARGKGE